MKHLSTFLILALLAFLYSCSGTENLATSDLNSLNLEIEQVDGENPHYKFLLSGFMEDRPGFYKYTTERLSELHTKDVLEINQLNEDQISAKVKNDPLSYNRVLWALGSEHFRKHSTDYESPKPTGTDRDELPELIGGINALMSEVRYPEGLNGIEGRVMVEFIISRFGEVEDPFVTRSLHSAADREAIRAVKKMKFKPGILDGVPVKTKYSLPVFFRAP